MPSILPNGEHPAVAVIRGTTIRIETRVAFVQRSGLELLRYQSDFAPRRSGLRPDPEHSRHALRLRSGPPERQCDA